MDTISPRFAELLTKSDEELLAVLSGLLFEHSILRGDFTLKSGMRSSWFIDVKATACYPLGMSVISLLNLRKIDPSVNAIGGQTMGADPIAFATAALGGALGRDLVSFAIRKEPKDHGGGGSVAGVLREGDRVAIVEDASTRGTSMLAAIEAVNSVGATVVQALSVVDRGGSARGLLAQYGVPFVALLSAPDLDLPYEGGLEEFMSEGAPQPPI